MPGEVLRGDGATLPLKPGLADATVTDPPYFDEAAYADLSDFFYVWLKRGSETSFRRYSPPPSPPRQKKRPP